MIRVLPPPPSIVPKSQKGIMGGGAFSKEKSQKKFQVKFLLDPGAQGLMRGIKKGGGQLTSRLA